MEEKIYAILTDIRPEFDFKESDNFVEDGFLDSFDVVTLVSEIEEKFDVIVENRKNYASHVMIFIWPRFRKCKFFHFLKPDKKRLSSLN